MSWSVIVCEGVFDDGWINLVHRRGYMGLYNIDPIILMPPKSLERWAVNNNTVYRNRR